MGVEDSIRKATENAMEDLAGTSKPVNDQQVPEPGEKDDDIQVHSSISEGSNAMGEDLSPDRPSTGSGTGAGSRATTGSGSGATTGSGTAAGQSHSDADTPDADTLRDDEADAATPPASGDVPGPAGLPEGDPDDLRADPSEGGGDPSTSMGRG